MPMPFSLFLVTTCAMQLYAPFAQANADISAQIESLRIGVPQRFANPSNDSLGTVCMLVPMQPWVIAKTPDEKRINAHLANVEQKERELYWRIVVATKTEVKITELKLTSTYLLGSKYEIGRLGLQIPKSFKISSCAPLDVASFVMVEGAHRQKYLFFGEN
jgi:hypothetical protein